MNESSAATDLVETQLDSPRNEVETAAARICIVTGEIAGPDFNGGIGTANRTFAIELHRAGYEVDVLYTRVNDGSPFSFRTSFDEQVETFRSLGIRLMCIYNPGRWND